MASTSAESAKSPPPSAKTNTARNIIVAVLVLPIIAVIGTTVLGEQSTEAARIKIATAGGKCKIERRIPAWLRMIAGDEFHTMLDQSVITEVTMEGENIGDAEVSKVVAANGLETLTIDNCKATSVCLNDVAKLKSLKSLTLSQTQVTDLSALAALPNLEKLDLNFSAVRDENLSSLGQFPKLHYLNVRGLMITDKGVVEIAKCSKLDYIHLGGAHLSPTGLQPLKVLKELKSIVLNDATFDNNDLQQLKEAIPGLAGGK